MEIITCPSCQRKLRLPESIGSKHLQCPMCAQTFEAASVLAEQVPEPSATAEALFTPRTLQDRSPTRSAEVEPLLPDSGERRGEVTCPHCHARVPAGFLCCEKCGAELESTVRRTPAPSRVSAPAHDLAPHRGGLVLTLGIVGLVLGLTGLLSPIGLPLSIGAWATGHSDLNRMREHVMDPAGEGSTHTGWICGIVGTALNVACGSCCFTSVVISMLH